jgi:nitrile hydratase accessory protein
LSAPDPGIDLPRLPRDRDGPVFAEPWEAQAFALAVKLSDQGHFTWKEWAEALGRELREAAERGEPDDGSHYYHHWLAALEHLVMAKGLTDRMALGARKLAWAEPTVTPLTASPSNWLMRPAVQSTREPVRVRARKGLLHIAILGGSIYETSSPQVFASGGRRCRAPVRIAHRMGRKPIRHGRCVSSSAMLPVEAQMFLCE